MLLLPRLAFVGLLLMLFTATACSSAPEPSSVLPEDLPAAAQAVSTTSPSSANSASVEQLKTPVFLTSTPTMTPSPTGEPIAPSPEIVKPSPTKDVPTQTATPTATVPYTDLRVLGTSVEGREIEAYQFGNGPNHIILVGGMHGGYEWNTSLLAYKAIDHFQEYPDLVPDSVTLTIIPSANPDGQYLVTGKEGAFLPENVAPDTAEGRFNANGVDLNRNWDCEWTEENVVWRRRVVSAGAEAFSEKETQILRDFFLREDPEVVIFWHSAANGVFIAGCPDVDEKSEAIAQIFGEAAGYSVFEDFDLYPVTGDASDWLTTQGISSITVELQNHEELDWSQNLQGILAVLEPYR